MLIQKGANPSLQLSPQCSGLKSEQWEPRPEEPRWAACYPSKGNAKLCVSVYSFGSIASIEGIRMSQWSNLLYSIVARVPLTAAAHAATSICYNLSFCLFWVKQLISSALAGEPQFPGSPVQSLSDYTNSSPWWLWVSRESRSLLEALQPVLRGRFLLSLLRSSGIVFLENSD
ncbi:small integral membrane protein 13 isoform X2 [Nannospalax galili]|uniref:small integral membrane protein 13 isoform X2 n=1 Tax=Nannospalax galili TaxID=1026970 RepID=UPI00111C4336|nr:small integral membrane protein 13 isoform X2 [Nannospalax galili]